MTKTITLSVLMLLTLTFGSNTAWAVSPPPTVTSVTVPANKTYIIGDALTFTVNFDQNINVTALPFLTMTLNSGNVYAYYVSGSGTNALIFSYTVSINDFDADGIVVGSALSINGGTIKNGSSIDAILTLNGVGATTGVLVDGVAPTVTGIGLANIKSNYLTSDVISVRLSTNKNMIVTGIPTVILTIGSTQVNAVYASTLQNNMFFNYTVQASDYDSDGINVNPTITLNGGSVKDAAGNNLFAFMGPPMGLPFPNTVNVVSTSVAEANQIAQLSVYPNPALDVIHLSSTEGIQHVSIINLAGSVVWSGSASQFPINVSSFAKGIYLLNMVSVDGVKTEKVVIK